LGSRLRGNDVLGPMAEFYDAAVSRL